MSTDTLGPVQENIDSFAVDGDLLVKPPKIEDAKRIERGRRVTFEWDLGEVPGDTGPGRAICELSILHVKAGINYATYERTTEDYFAVSISRSYAENNGDFAVRSFWAFNGVGIGRVPAGNRYSAKKLREAEAHGIKVFERLIEEGNEQVLAYFDKDHDPQLGQ